MPFLTSVTTPVREALRQAISAHHAAASDEGLLARLRAEDLSGVEYDQILLRFHALHEAHAEAVSTADCPPWTDSFQQALRRNALEQDLSIRRLRASSQARSTAHDLFAPVWAETATAPGWAGRSYILVGSLLGAKVIRNALISSLGIDENKGAAFFCRDPGGSFSPAAFFDLLETTQWSAEELVELCAAAAAFMRAHAEYWRLEHPL